MITSDRETRETRRIEQSLRRQLHWIENDIVITLLGPDERIPAAENGEVSLPAAVSSTTGRTDKQRVLPRLLRWSANRLRSIAAVFE